MVWWRRSSDHAEAREELTRQPRLAPSPRPWWSGTPELDEERVGITFVDLLFALVVGQVLDPLRRWWTIPATGWSHLAVAMVLTMASWIGYHTSANRPRYAIKVANYPLLQFVLDVAMVIAYWIAAATTPLPEYSPGRSLPAPPASATSESVLVTVSFVLYFLWDRVAKVMQDSTANYPAMQRKPYDKGRRVVTVVFGLAAALMTGLAWWVDRAWHNPRSWVIGIDCGLIGILVAYRAAKELWKNAVTNKKLPLSSSARLPGASTPAG
jgi:hypothetical protein